MNQPPGQSPFAQGNRLAHLNSKIKRCMADYHEKFGGTVMLKQICNAAGVAMEDLPWLRKYMDNQNRNQLCYNHVMGVCLHGRRCHFIHAPQNEVDDGFATALCTKLESGVKYLIRNNEAPPGSRTNNPGGGGRNVRQRD